MYKYKPINIDRQIGKGKGTFFNPEIRTYVRVLGAEKRSFVTR